MEKIWTTTGPSRQRNSDLGDGCLAEIMTIASLTQDRIHPGLRATKKKAAVSSGLFRTTLCWAD
jgi:hypothetical protein